MSKSKLPDLARFRVSKPASSPTVPAQNVSPGYVSPEYKLKGFRIRTEASKQLAMLKVTTDRDQQDLLADALNLLFEQHGLPPIA